MKSIYLSHLSDEGSYFGINTSEKLKNILALNLLFNDSLVVSISAILGNKLFFELWTKDLSSISKIFQKGIIKPVVLKNENNISCFTDLAHHIIKSKTIVRLPPSELLNHANLIDNSVIFSSLPSVSENIFRRQFYRNFRRLTDHINKNGLQGTNFVEPNLLNVLMKELEKTDVNKLTCSSVYKVAESKLNKKIRDDVKISSLAIYEHTLSKLVADDIAETPHAGIFSNEFNFINTKDKETQACYDAEVVNIEANLPFQELSNLPLEIVLELRDIPALKKFRERVFQYTNTLDDINIKKISDSLVESIENIDTVLRSHPFKRNEAIQKINLKPRIKITKWFSKSIVPIIPPIIALSSGVDDPNKLVLLGLSSYLLGSLIPAWLENMSKSNHLFAGSEGFNIIVNPSGKVSFQH